ncbi:MAG: hypothetical protein WCG42_00405 [Parachlamydiaceae bacterium]
MNKTHHTLGSFRELFFLFLPMCVMTLSNCLFLFFEKLFLAKFSVESMEAALNAAYACQIFQAPCVALSMMAQVFVGQWRGAQEWRSIGPGIWQFIWFSFLSSLITFPFGMLYGLFYFRGTAIDDIVWPYYTALLGMNFLFPLGAALSCFYIGQGKTKFVLFVTIGTQLVKFFLGYLLIFGWDSWVPAFGLLGGVFSTLTAQTGFCLLLFLVFLNKKHANLYNTRDWVIKLKLFWNCIHTGLLRAANRILNFMCWASIAHLMSAKGGDYLLILSIGGTLFLFLPFFAEALCQAEITVFSNILGAKEYFKINQAFRSGGLLTLLIIGLSATPLIFYKEMFELLFPTIFLEDSIILNVFFGVWVSFVFYSLAFVPISYVLACKDTKFSFFMGFFNWINGFLLIYTAIETVNIPADLFWLVLGVMHASTMLLYYLRMKWLMQRGIDAFGVQKGGFSNVLIKFVDFFHRDRWIRSKTG